jgi:hypothetical protein
MSNLLTGFLRKLEDINAKECARIEEEKANVAKASSTPTPAEDKTTPPVSKPVAAAEATLDAVNTEPLKYGLLWTDKRKKRISKIFRGDAIHKLFLATRSMNDADFESTIAGLEMDLIGDTK